jgi:hypothetical protein
VREKLLQAWETFGKVQRIRRGVDRLNDRARTVKAGVRVGVGTANYLRGIADEGPTEEEFKDAAWAVACRGYDEAKVAYHRHLDAQKKAQNRRKKGER